MLRAESSNSKGPGGDIPTSSGELQHIAARVLMKLLYAARMAGYDLLHAIGRLACLVTKWDSHCDKMLHRLMCYVSCTKHLRLVGWVGLRRRTSVSTCSPMPTLPVASAQAGPPLVLSSAWQDRTRVSRFKRCPRSRRAFRTARLRRKLWLQISLCDLLALQR